MMIQVEIVDQKGHLLPGLDIRSGAVIRSLCRKCHDQTLPVSAENRTGNRIRACSGIL